MEREDNFLYLTWTIAFHINQSEWQGRQIYFYYAAGTLVEHVFRENISSMSFTLLLGHSWS